VKNYAARKGDGHALVAIMGSVKKIARHVDCVMQRHPVVPPDSRKRTGHGLILEGVMKTRIIVGVIVLIGVLAVGTLASRAGDVAGRRQWTVVNFVDPVQVKDQIVMGPVLIVHDDDKMGRGEACTTFYRFEAGKGPKEALISFHCLPRQKSAVAQTTFSTVDTPNGCKRLVEYQIGGDAEAHGIPLK